MTFDPEHFCEDTEYYDTYDDAPPKSKKRPKYKGYTLKREYCKSIGISIKTFNEILVDEGILHWHLISEDQYRNTKKYAYGITDHEPRIAKPYRGSNQQGTFQYKIDKLNEIFSRRLCLTEL